MTKIAPSAALATLLTSLTCGSQTGPTVDALTMAIMSMAIPVKRKWTSLRVEVAATSVICRGLKTTQTDGTQQRLSVAASPETPLKSLMAIPSARTQLMESVEKAAGIADGLGLPRILKNIGHPEPCADAKTKCSISELQRHTHKLSKKIISDFIHA